MKALQERETARLRALVDGDLDSLASFLDPQLHYTHSTGRVDNYASWMELVRSGATQYLELEHDLESTTEIGDLLFSTGQMRLRLVSGGVEKHLSTTTRCVWSSIGSDWTLRSFVGLPQAGYAVAQTAV